MRKISEEKAESEHRKSQKRFKKKDFKKLLENEDGLLHKFLNVNNLKEYIDEFRLLVSLLKDWYKGRYTSVPWKVISSIGGALLYVLSPIDLIPDFLPFVGYVDDAAVLAACLRYVREDVEQYRIWKQA